MIRSVPAAAQMMHFMRSCSFCGRLFVSRFLLMSDSVELSSVALCVENMASDPGMVPVLHRWCSVACAQRRRMSRDWQSWPGPAEVSRALKARGVERLRFQCL